MNVEEVKHLIEMRKNYPAHKNIVNAKLFTEGLDILINEIERLNEELNLMNDIYGYRKSKHEILYNVAHELTNRKLGCDLSYYGEEGIQELITELDQISQITRDMSINIQTTGYTIKPDESDLNEGELTKEQYTNYKKVADEFYGSGELLFEINLDEKLEEL